MHDLLEQGKKILNACNLLVCDKDESVVDDGFHLVGVGYHVGGDVASVELHALDNLCLGLCNLRLLNGDNAVGGDLLHSVGNDSADILVSGGNGGYSRDVLGALNRLRVGLDSLDSGVNGLLDALLDDHRVCACNNVLHALADECLSEQGSGGGAVAGDIVCLCGDFFYKLSAHVLKGIFELNILGDGDTVVGDEGSAVLLVEHNVSALGAERDFNCVSELIDTGLESLAGFLAVNDLFCHDELPPIILR